MSDADRIEALLGRRPTQLQVQSGGDIARGVRLTLNNDEQAMAKFARPGQPSLKIEARMLADLRAAGLPVPPTLAVDDDVLLLEWVDAGGRRWDDTAQRSAGRAVAMLHQQRLSDQFGYAYDTFIGRAHQPNPLTDTWIDFFRDQRLLARADAALAAGRLPAALRHRLDGIAGRLEQWLDLTIHTSLVHGDLWGGNMLPTADGGACFIDPAIYYGHGEVDLAMAMLFNSVGEAFFDGYRDVRAIAPGFFEQRSTLYQLYPLLVHVELFGGSYVVSVDNALARLGG